MGAVEIEKGVLEEMWFGKQGPEEVKVGKEVREEAELEREVLKHEDDAGEELVSIVTLCRRSPVLTIP